MREKNTARSPKAEENSGKSVTSSKNKEEQQLIDKSTSGLVGAIPGKLRSHLFRVQSEAALDVDSENWADLDQLTRWFASDEARFSAGDPPLTPQKKGNE